METEKEIKELEEKGYIHYFDWEIYLIICMSYIFGFIAGYAKGYLLLISLIFLSVPFYLKWKQKKK